MMQKYPLEKLEGRHIQLRKHEPGLAREMYRLVDEDRVRLGRFLPWVAGMHSVADEEDYIRFSHLSWEEHKLFDWGIFLKEGGAYVGNIGVHTISWDNDRCELGYWIASGHEGQGIMSEAVTVLEQEMFRLGFHRIEIHCDPENLRSASVPKRCGYALEGVLRDHKVENGKRRGTMIWAKLAG